MYFGSTDAIIMHPSRVIYIAKDLNVLALQYMSLIITVRIKITVTAVTVIKSWRLRDRFK